MPSGTSPRGSKAIRTRRRPAARSSTSPRSTTLPAVSVHFGQFRTHAVGMPLANPTPGKRRIIQVLKTEEKGSDVNLATYLLLDGLDGLYDSALVISDDSDLEAPIREANRRFGAVQVVSPRGPATTPTGPRAPYVMSHAGSSWTPLDPRLLCLHSCRLRWSCLRVERSTARLRGVDRRAYTHPESDPRLPRAGSRVRRATPG